uniref:Cytochrome P450 n=1 Tax=Oryza brachyantha TaxID=4533 RepID=J3MQE2_ORYBR
MEDWLYYLLSFTLCLALHLLLRAVTGKLAAPPRLPPGSSAVTVIIGPLLFLGRSNFAVKPIIRAARRCVVESVMAVQREFSTSALGFQALGMYPAVTKLVFRRRWRQMLSLRRRQEELYIPLIRAREARHRHGVAGEEGVAASYVDSLLTLRIPENGGRNLTEGEMASLCAEFFVAGTESTAAVAQWIMANLVARPEIQAKLRQEIRAVVGVGGGGVQEEHLRMPYLRAVVLEALRLHPPGHFVRPHAAVPDDDDDAAAALIDGFHVPRHATVNFTVADMALDEAVWPDAARFRPERFLPGGEGADVDLTGGREIKRMPFGAGRRACPGVALALLHLECLVGNLVAASEWRDVAGEAVNFAEKQEISVVMRRPLRAVAMPCHTILQIKI